MNPHRDNQTAKITIPLAEDEDPLRNLDGYASADELTPRETEVVKLIAEGLSSKEIARQLGISFKTVVCHRFRLMNKLDVHETASLVRYAVHQKLINP